MALRLIAVFLCSQLAAGMVCADPVVTQGLERQLKLAAGNRNEIEKALEDVVDSQRASMAFLIKHMPEQDLKSLSAEFLLDNVRLAHEARESSSWKISDELFLNDVLPYANVDEPREAWRSEMRDRAAKIVKDCKTPGEAAQRLNQKLFKEVGVKYSTKRKRANQSPGESIEQGLASCTGLSILLVDACRSVNVPARLVGVPSWTTKRGNHTWVEVWEDGDWHFTGAAEYSPNGLDDGWFIKDASKADKSSRMHSIYAISYRTTDTQFPIVWSDGGPKAYAVNVTDRYTKIRKTEAGEEIEVRVLVRSKETGERVKVQVQVCLAEETSEQCAFGTSRGETDDTNNILSFKLQQGRKYKLQADGLAKEYYFVADIAKQQTISLEVTDSLEATEPEIDKKQAASLAKELYEKRLEQLRESRQAEWKAKLITIDDADMRFELRVYGQAPKNGHSLYISMHGGGQAPARVNDQQWRNQIDLYKPKEGIYLAPRAPTDAWNMWHKGHIDKFFARIIEDAVAIEGVDPNRVYIMGYSAGGDGVYQLAPRMADQLAAAAMMAGHPNNASPLSLRNIGFTLHMGAKDSAYKRNKIAAEWKEKLAKLKADDAGGYEHEVVIHPNVGHWMQRKDAVAVPWMAKFTRDPLPKKVAWQQSGVTHNQFYWLAASPTDQVQGARMIVSRDGNEFVIHETKKVSQVIIRLNDAMVDFDQPITVKHGDKTHTFKNIKRTKAMIEKTLAERSDLNAVFSAQVKVKLN